MIYRLMRQCRPMLVFLFCAILYLWADRSCPAGAAPLLLNGGRTGGEPPELGLLLDDISGRQATVIDLQRELVSRPAVGPEYGGAGEEKKARWIEGWLTGRGIAYERLDFSDERVPAKVRPNLVVLYPAQTPGQGADKSAARLAGRTLWLLSHLDVADPGPRELWQGDPFALRIDGDRMYGRGVEDNNQAIATSLLLLESLRKTGVAPPLRLGLIMTSGALVDYRTGIGHVLDRKPDLFGPDDLVVVMDYGNAQGSLVSVGEKGNIWLKVTVTGKNGHAGRPDMTKNPFAAGAALATGLRGLETSFPDQNPLFEPPHTTITPTRTEDYSTGINHIPAKFVFYVDGRVMPGNSFIEVEKAVRDLADVVAQNEGVSIRVERIEVTPPPKITPPDAPVLAVLSRAVRAVLGVDLTYVGTGSVTMAATLRDKGVDTVVWGVQATLHNKPEEYALISAHIKQAQVLAWMLFDLHLSVDKLAGPSGGGATGAAGGI